jgi:hypothetical protein
MQGRGSDQCQNIVIAVSNYVIVYVKTPVMRFTDASALKGQKWHYWISD